MVIGQTPKPASSLHKRFIISVLAPPFVVLLLLAGFGLWQLNELLHRQALDDLRRAAATTAAKLDREFALRETVLKRTGEEIFIIKSEYQNERNTLDSKREKCREHVLRRLTFNGAPDGVCEPFEANGGNFLVIIEDQYVAQAQALIEEQDQQINARLSAFKQFFPETLGLLVMDGSQQVVSTALSGAFKGSAETFQADAAAALTQPQSGKVVRTEDFELAVFAYPITGGSVLVAYDLHNEHFIRQIWEGTPIDRAQALAVILDPRGTPIYPSLQEARVFQDRIGLLRQTTSIEVQLGEVPHTVVGVVAGTSDWMVAVASPTAVVLAPARDSRLIGIAVIGFLIVGYLWLGTFFIRRTLQNINRLVGGALVFGSGRLDYKITLSHAADEFGLLADTMNNMGERIAAAERAIDEKNKEFISVATHELRTPMTAIIGHLTLVKDMYSKQLPPQAVEMIDQAYYGTARLRDLVNDMLNVARLESGRSESALAAVAIKKVISEVVETMSIVADIADVKLQYHDKHAAEIIADEARLRIIINNFVSNAIKYNRPGGKVLVAHEVKDNQLITSVADSGLGIPEDQKSQMFEKFFRVQHDDRKSVTGTGLGMYIVKQYIEQMQGRLWFESVHGKGTTFYFSLPLSRPVHNDESSPHKSKTHRKTKHTK